MEIHHLQRIHHLISTLDVVLIVHHVVNRYLTLPPALLRCHRHVVRLVHRILILTILVLLIITLGIWVLHYFVHLDLVSNWRRWLRILHCVKILLLLQLLLQLIRSQVLLMDVVFASSRSSATGIRIDASNTIVWSCDLIRSRLLVCIWAVFLGYIDGWSVMAAFA